MSTVGANVLVGTTSGLKCVGVGWGVYADGVGWRVYADGVGCNVILLNDDGVGETAIMIR